MKKIISFFFLVSISCTLHAQAPVIEWAKCFGGDSTDIANSIINTTDGGFIFAGYTNSIGEDFIGKHLGNDAWVTKLNHSGTIEWSRCYGGDGDEEALCIIQTNDGGYVFAGQTDSNSGVITDNHGKNDAWIVKLDKSGNIQWQKCFGGEENDFAVQVIQTSDRGYAFLGTSASKDSVFLNKGVCNVWIVKLDSNGAFQWQKLLGGSRNDYGVCLAQTEDHGFLIGGQANSTDGDVTLSTGKGDPWIIRLSSSGDTKWQRCYYTEGGVSAAKSITLTRDGGFAFTGLVYGYPTHDFPNIHGADYDAYVIQYNSSDSFDWVSAYGGQTYDGGGSIIQSSDGDLILAGGTNSNDGDVLGNPSHFYDAWIVKLNTSSRKIKWQKCLGGSGSTNAYSVIQSPDGGFVFAGHTSGNAVDISGNHGGDDAWIVKLAAENIVRLNSNNENTSVTPNPSTGVGKISYFLTNPSNIKIELYNPLGERLRTLLDTKEDSGNHEQEFDLSELTSSMYFFRIELNGKIEMRKVELMK